ncbi:MAG: alpha/beta hydrolase-fold protein [Bacteroidota bacterium]
MESFTTNWRPGLIIMLFLSLYTPMVQSQGVTFRYLNPNATAVFLAGEMNNWSPAATPMTKDASGQWTVTLDLAPGQWLYKFVVDGKFISDPDPDALSTPDGQGGMHSYLLVGEGDYRYHLQIPHGTVESYNFQSSFLGLGVDVNVYIPPVTSTDSLPVLILLHGSGMDKQQWTDNGQIANYMDNLLAKRMVKPFIIAMPSYMPYSQSEDLAGFLTWDLPGFLKYKFSSSVDPKKLALGGMSLGGWITLRVGADNPRNFGSLFPISADVPMNAKEISDLAGLKKAGKLIVFCGTDDPLLKNNEYLAGWLTRNRIPFDYIKASGGHTWQYWNLITPDFLMKVSGLFPGK